VPKLKQIGKERKLKQFAKEIVGAESWL